MHHHVGPQGQRLLEIGGGKSVVDDEERPRLVRDPREGGDVDHGEQRIGGGLGPDDLGAPRSHRRAYGIEVGEIDRRVLDPPRLGDLGEESIGAAVGVIADDRVRAGGHHRAQQRVLGSEA